MKMVTQMPLLKLITEYEDYEGLKSKEKIQAKKSNFTIREDNKGNFLGKEFGFRVKGPEPTRFGDWERNGRCTDF